MHYQVEPPYKIVSFKNNEEKIIDTEIKTLELAISKTEALLNNTLSSELSSFTNVYRIYDEGEQCIYSIVYDDYINRTCNFEYIEPIYNIKRASRSAYALLFTLIAPISTYFIWLRFR